MPPLSFILKSLIGGKTLVRTLLDFRLSKQEFTGVIVDLGAGGSDQFTDSALFSSDTQIVRFDQKRGQETNFEKDRLPFESNQFDIVIFLNVLEHIYNHKHILKEISRIKKDSGQLIGFVPFLKWYHADPHDYFRYTYEALELMLKEVGYTDVTVETLYIGPYSTAFDMILPTLPKILRPVLYVPSYLLDIVFRSLRKKAATRYALGYYFIAR